MCNNNVFTRDIMQLNFISNSIGSYHNHINLEFPLNLDDHNNVCKHIPFYIMFIYHSTALNEIIRDIMIEEISRENHSAQSQNKWNMSEKALFAQQSAYLPLTFATSMIYQNAFPLKLIKNTRGFWFHTCHYQLIWLSEIK